MVRKERFLNLLKTLTDFKGNYNRGKVLPKAG
jgi:hypothetical protein